MSRLGDAKLFDDSKTELDEDVFEEVVKSNYGVYELTFGNVSEGTLSVLPSVIVVVLGAVYKIVFSFRPQREYVFCIDSLAGYAAEAPPTSSRENSVLCSDSDAETVILTDDSPIQKRPRTNTEAQSVSIYSCVLYFLFGFFFVLSPLHAQFAFPHLLLYQLHQMLSQLIMLLKTSCMSSTTGLE